MQNLEQLFEQTVLEWAKKTAQEKYTSWLGTLSEISHLDERSLPVGIDPGFGCQQVERMTASAAEFRKKINEINTYHELIEYIQDWVHGNTKERLKSRIKMMHGDGGIEDLVELSQMTLDSSFAAELQVIMDTFVEYHKAMEKIGLDTAIGDIEIEDVVYLIDVKVSSDTEAFQRWIVQFPRFYKNVRDDVEAISDSKTTLEIKQNHVDLINHYVDVNGVIDFDDELDDVMSATKDVRDDVSNMMDEYYDGIGLLTKLTFAITFGLDFKKSLINAKNEH